MSDDDRGVPEIAEILFATDFSKESEQAQLAAVAVAEAFGARVHPFHAIAGHEGTEPAGYRELIDQRRDAARAELGAVAEALASRVRCGEPTLGDLPVVGSALAHARAVGAGLIVLGSEGRTGLSRFLIGSTAEAIARYATCSVLVIRGSLDRAGPILVGTDFSEPAGEALAQACAFARRTDAKLHILHADPVVTSMIAPYEDGPPREFYAEQLRAAEPRLAEAADTCRGRCEATTELVRLDPRAALNETADRLDARLIVVGARGRSGIREIVLGSVAERTLRHANRSVWIARARPT